MREGRPEAPMRHPVAWQDEAFADEVLLDRELRRVFDICHGCRRCFDLCDSFPRLFDLIDATPSGELAEVASPDFSAVVEACTLCDLCFATRCPYVPPHPYDVDVPHLMLRARAVALGAEGGRSRPPPLARPDRTGPVGTTLSRVANWALNRRNELTRPSLEKLSQVHRDAALPAYASQTLERQAAAARPFVDVTAPAYGRKAVLYATCHGNYHAPEIGLAARAVLARNGVDTEVVYPGCCAHPQLQAGDIAAVAEAACAVAEGLAPWLDQGYAVIALVPSCALMMKVRWPLLVPEDWEEHALVRRLALATFDLSEYILDLARTEGLAEGLQPLDGDVFLHVACAARAQTMSQTGGAQAAELLRLLPGMALSVVERCSGRGEGWGVQTETFETAMALGRPVATRALKENRTYLASECPLAGLHIAQGVEALGGGTEPTPVQAVHPIQLLAKAYGL